MCYSYMCWEKAAFKLNGKNSRSPVELNSYLFTEQSLWARLCSKCFEHNSASLSFALAIAYWYQLHLGKETEHSTVTQWAQGQQLIIQYMKFEPREFGSRIHSLNQSIPSEDVMKVNMKRIYSSKHAIYFIPLSLIQKLILCPMHTKTIETLLFSRQAFRF